MIRDVNKKYLVILVVIFAGCILIIKNKPEPIVSAVPEVVQDAKQLDVFETTQEEPIQQSEKDEITAQEQLVYAMEFNKMSIEIYREINTLYLNDMVVKTYDLAVKQRTELEGLLKSQAIEDPRSAEPEVFNNKEIKQLYASYSSQLKISEKEALDSVIAIQNSNIDISTELLGASKDKTIIAIFEKLRKTSETDLRNYNSVIDSLEQNTDSTGSSALQKE